MKFLAAFTVLAISSASSVDATFTIAGVHPKTGEMGAAGCTCAEPAGTHPVNLYTVSYHSTPGEGLLLAQAKPPKAGNAVFAEAEKLLKQGTDPATILNTISTAAMDSDKGLIQVFNLPFNEVRQYGLVDSQGRSAGHTGPSIDDMYASAVYAGLQPNVQEDKQGKTASGEIAFTAQGNIVSADTVSILVNGFQQGNDTEACFLADRLYNALVAVDEANTKARSDPNATPDNNFVGDVRCESGHYFQNHLLTPGFGFPGLQAYLHVEDQYGNEVLHIEAKPIGGVNPIDQIRSEYKAWRAQKNCPVARKLRGTTN